MIKMKKIFACMVGAMFAMCLMAAPAWADSRPFVQDNYDLFDPDTEAQLEQQAQDINDTYGVAPYFVTVDNIGVADVRDYAEQYYWDGLGLGPDDSVIMFLLSVDDRWYVTITRGDGIYWFSDYGIADLEDAIVTYLGDDDWVGAANEYYYMCDWILDYGVQSGAPYDVDNKPKGSPLIALVAAIIAGLIAAFVVTGILRSGMKSAKEKESADDFLSKGSFHLSSRNDRFIRSAVTKTAVPKDDDRGSSGGGSTVSSSGFGGSSGGRF